MWRSQTDRGRPIIPRSRQAETDRATMDPPLTSAKALWSAGQGQVDERIFMSLFGACLFIEKPGSVLLSGRGLRLDHTAQMQIYERAWLHFPVINPHEEADDLGCPAECQKRKSDSLHRRQFSHTY